MPAAADDWYSQSEGSTSATAYDTPTGGAYAPESTPGTGLGVGLKLGYGLPMGDAVKDGAFDRFTKGAVQTEFALTYGLTPSFILGGYAGLGFGLLPSKLADACDGPDIDCSLFFLSFGLHAEYRFLPGYIANPWLGGNFGMEWAHQSASSSGIDVSSSLFGLAFGPSVGVDFEIARWGIGPFVSYQAGRFLTADFNLTGLGDDGDDGGGSGSIDNKAFHGWLTFGARARYTFAN